MSDEDILYIGNPEDEDSATLPATRDEVFYTTVHRDGQTMIVPYNPGRFEPLRALETLVSGASLVAASGSLASGHYVAAAVCGAIAIFEFICGMRRWTQQ